MVNNSETPFTPYNYNNIKEEISDENILIMIDVVQNIDGMESIFRFRKNLCQLLNIILSKFEIIVKIYEKKKTYIHIFCGY